MWMVLAGSGAQAGQFKEYDVKAAFLLNFAKFVEWPAKAYADSNAPVVIGIVGNNPFGDTLEKLVEGQTAQGRRIQIRYLKADENDRECQMLFLTGSVAAQAKEILRRVQGRPVLTVSEDAGFVQQGGVIGLVLVEQSVRFHVNMKAAGAAELKISSKLLGVARSVIGS
jgi:hypothetical protein